MLLRIGEIVERVLHAGQADLAGDQRRDVDLAVGDQSQAGGEFLGRIGEDELHIELLDDAEERLELVGLHADADHHHAGAGGRAFQHALDHAGNADAFEDHAGALLRAGAKQLRETAGIVAGGRRRVGPAFVR